jgi:hypothetical protein
MRLFYVAPLDYRMTVLINIHLVTRVKSTPHPAIIFFLSKSYLANPEILNDLQDHSLNKSDELSMAPNLSPYDLKAHVSILKTDEDNEYTCKNDK